MRCFVTLAAFAATLVLASCAGNTAGNTPKSAPSPVLGRSVRIDLPSNEGTLVSLPARRPATTIDGFAPSCEPCRSKVPALVARQAELSARGVQLVLVAVLEDDESSEDAKAALVSWGVPADQPFLVDRGAVLRRELGIEGLPASVVLDAQGRVRWVAPAGASADEVVHASIGVAEEN